MACAGGAGDSEHHGPTDSHASARSKLAQLDHRSPLGVCTLRAPRGPHARPDPMPDPDDVTRYLADFAAGDRAALESLMPKVYGELRRLAGVHLRSERAGHTLQPTALVHEAFLRLSEADDASIEDRMHFFRLASRLMRQILVDHARAKQTLKRGGELARVTLTDVAGGPATETDVLGLEDALVRLEKLDARKARLVELRFFGGLGEEQAADAIGISRTQAAREWRVTRAWLADELVRRGGA